MAPESKNIVSAARKSDFSVTKSWNIENPLQQTCQQTMKIYINAYVYATIVTLNKHIIEQANNFNLLHSLQK